MDTQAPPTPDTGHDAAANCEDAFDAVARRLDALLQSTSQADDATPEPTHADTTPPPTANPAADPAATSTAEPEMLDLNPAAPPPAAAAPTDAPVDMPTQAADAGDANAPDASDLLAQLLDAPGSAEDAAGGAPVVMAPVETAPPLAGDALGGLDDPGDAAPDPSPTIEDNTQAPATDPAASVSPTESPAQEPATAEVPGLDPNTPDPSPLDLDAEIEALLAEQPIDPEVLGAAEEIAQRDAEEAEQNKEALRLRAAEAAQLLEAIDGDATPTEDDITSEIDSLLAAAEDTPIAPATKAQDSAPPAEPTIDQLDQMLATEAQDDDDLDLAGSFFSTDAIAAGDTAGGGETLDLGDGLTGSFTGGESPNATPDVFPVDRADTHPVPEPGGEESIDMDAPVAWWRKIDWQHVMAIAEEITRRVCWLINWPARRFLTAEWRATVGYLALLQVAGAAAVWLFLVIL